MNSFKLIFLVFACELAVPAQQTAISGVVTDPSGDGIAGKYNSALPWIHAGNMDNKEFVAGSTLYIPVHASGALFEVGDGHAGQGDGEVDITAMETRSPGPFSSWCAKTCIWHGREARRPRTISSWERTKNWSSPPRSRFAK